MKGNSWFCLCLWLWTWPASVRAQPENPAGVTYKMGYAASVRFGYELHRALKPKFRPLVDSRPIRVDMSDTPFIRVEENVDPEVGKPLGVVVISAGFIDLVNNVAHAKAIDRIEKGYFRRYVLSLGQETGTQGLRELPNLSDPRYWTEAMMNEQLTFYNQTVGVCVGAKLATYYRGYYRKYAGSLRDPQGNPVSIYSLLSQAEWDDSLKWGAVNALDCALATEGVIALFEAIDRMPRRPAWTEFFVPEKVKVSKCKRDLERLEKRFFSGERFEPD